MNWINLKKKNHKWVTDKDLTFRERLADLISEWVGSWTCVCIHIVWFAAWILINSNVTPLKPFDPYTFNLLTMVVSLEAIFLTMFVLIAQNRQAKQDRIQMMMNFETNKKAEKDIREIKAMLLQITKSQEQIIEELEELEED